MSASPNNASAGVTAEALVAQAPLIPQTFPQTGPPGGEALQALLAFSSLHEQIRQRQAQEKHAGKSAATEDVWELEQFVLDEVLYLVAERALAITGADGIAIALVEGNAIVCRASAGTIAPDRGMRLDPNSGFSGMCLSSGKIIRCDDAEVDSRVNVNACRRLGTRSMVAVPLLARQNVIGLLEAFSTEAYGFNDTDVRSLGLLAELILAAIKPEEEDRMAEISRQVVASAATPSQELALPVNVASREAESTKEPPAEAAEKAAMFAWVRVPVLGSTPGLAMVVVLVLLALAAGGGVWWRLRHTTPGAPAVSQQVSANPASVPAKAVEQTAPPVSNGTVVVTGIRHWSSLDSSTVVVDLQDQVAYEAHRLTEPERIYFDLRDTTLAAGLFGKIIEINDTFLARVRVAQSTDGVTRVVLETKGQPTYSVSMEQNPYRLVVEVRKPGAKPEDRAQLELFAPAIDSKTSRALISGLKHPPNRRATPSIPKFRIVLDAGHGGWDLGTVGRHGLMEKDLTLDIVGRLGKLIESRLGAEVVYTRDNDTYVSLERRTEIANLAQSDLFLSVHANYSDDHSARGTETYYTNTYSSIRARTSDPEADTEVLKSVDWTNVDVREKAQESRKFAEIVQRALHNSLAAGNQGIRNRGARKASYVVLTGTTMPAVLAEVSFLSSPTDETALRSEAYRQRIAEALYKGVMQYAKESHRVKVASAGQKANGG